MPESARRVRRVASPRAEALERREVMSFAAQGLAAVRLQYDLSRHYATPQTGEVDLTVTRSAAGMRRALVFRVETEGFTQVPSPFGSGATEARKVPTTGPDASVLPIVPIAGTYRFAPGRTSLTIPVRLNPDFVPPGPVVVPVLAYLPRSPVSSRSFWRPELTIVPSLDQVPPEVVSSSVTPQAITVTFSKPMDPATVQDLGNYDVFGSPKARKDHTDVPVTLASAAYDEATRTLTLTPTAPLDAANYNYVVDRNTPPQAGAKPPTDLQGNALADLSLLSGG